MAKFDNYKIWQKDQTILVKVMPSDFDRATSVDLKPLVECLLKKYSFETIVLDFSHVVLIDGAALAEVISALNLCNSQNKQLTLCSLNSNIRELINSKGLFSLFEMHRSTREALEAAKKYDALNKQLFKATSHMEAFFGASIA